MEKERHLFVISISPDDDVPAEFVNIPTDGVVSVNKLSPRELSMAASFLTKTLCETLDDRFHN